VILAHADNVVLLEKSQGKLKDTFFKLEEAAVKVGLQYKKEKRHTR